MSTPRENPTSDAMGTDAHQDAANSCTRPTQNTGEDAGIVSSAANKTRDCKTKQIRFVYPAKSDQVQILRPCLEWNCRTCRVYQRHHFAGQEATALQHPPGARPQHQRPAVATAHEPSGSRPREVRYLQDVEAERSRRVTPRFQKRVVLRFRKPGPGHVSSASASAYHAFGSFVRENDVPLYTGPSGIPGATTTLKFRQKKEEFRELVEGWGGDQIQARGRAENDEVMEDEEEEEEEGEEERKERGGEEQAAVLDEEEDADPGEACARPVDQWWDEEDEDGRRWRRRVW